MGKWSDFLPCSNQRLSCISQALGAVFEPPQPISPDMFAMPGLFQIARNAQQKKWNTYSTNGWGDFQKAASPKWCVENCFINVYTVFFVCICVIVYSYIWECLIKLLSGAVAFWKFGEETSENEINKCYSRKFLHEYVTHIWWTSYIQ